MQLYLKNGDVYHLRFWYGDFPDGIRATFARIQNSHKGIASEGFAYCDPRDNFRKDIGRKIAISRALRDFSRPLRKDIWQAYFENIGYENRA